MKVFVTLLLATIVLATIVDMASACDCDYHPGGCTISSPAEAGNKCKCRYKGPWTCEGLEMQCSSSERDQCVGNCMSHDCCVIGGGDCGGY